ncbi:MAG TPA: hypothetical protein VKQ36_11140 [Ktedonobacterales bacterium]|nr:hypothetical protein [Ktedonobacterales bacterium]
MTSQTDSVADHAFTFGMTYNDAGQQTSLTYSENELMTYGYKSYGWHLLYHLASRVSNLIGAHLILIRLFPAAQFL